MESPKNRYIIFPGEVTGDLWHVAAAQILSSEYGDPNVHYVAVIIISDAKENQASLKDWIYGGITFNYLRTLGLDCLLVKMGDKYDKRTFEQTMYVQGEAWFDKTYQHQHDKGYQKLLFKELSALPANALNVEPTSKQGNEKVILQGNTRLIALMDATTIAVDFLYNPQAKALDQTRWKLLGERMSAPKGGSVDETAKNLALEKFKQLKTLGGDGLIIIENYRVGHVNSQTDSSPALSEFLDKWVSEIWQGKCKKVTVAAVNTQKEWEFLTGAKSKGRALLDLYNKGTADLKWNLNNDWPGLDVRAQAYFWKLVAEDPNIVGLFGGRSGSVDIAGFCGVRVFFWDEPWIEFGTGSKETGLGDATKPNDPPSSNSVAKVYEQVPQCLRSLQLAAFMSTGLPEFTVQPNWQTVREPEISRWLKAIHSAPRNAWPGKLSEAIYPSPPAFGNWVMLNSLNDYRRAFLERPELGIVAHILDDMGYTSEKPGAGWGNKFDRKI